MHTFSKDTKEEEASKKEGEERFSMATVLTQLSSLFIHSGRRNSFPTKRLKSTHQFRGWNWMVLRDPARVDGEMLPSISEFSADDFEE